VQKGEIESAEHRALNLFDCWSITIKEMHDNLKRLNNRDVFKVGDIVTRDGSDRHEVIAAEDDFRTIKVKCIKAPDMPWAKIGDEEDNLARRYSLIEKYKECYEKLYNPR